MKTEKPTIIFYANGGFFEDREEWYAGTVIKYAKGGVRVNDFWAGKKVDGSDTNGIMDSFFVQSEFVGRLLMTFCGPLIERLLRGAKV